MVNKIVTHLLIYFDLYIFIIYGTIYNWFLCEIKTIHQSWLRFILVAILRLVFQNRSCWVNFPQHWSIGLASRWCQLWFRCNLICFLRDDVGFDLDVIWSDFLIREIQYLFLWLGEQANLLNLFPQDFSRSFCYARLFSTWSAESKGLQRHEWSN